jgi:pilin isopeptide linkage protein
MFLGAEYRRKYLDNKLAAGFEFALAENGNVISNAVSDEEGIFSFESLVLSKPGFYTYEVYEVAGEDESIEYDENVYTVMVEVTKNGQALEAEIYVTDEGQEAQIVFHNATVVYEIEDPDIPLAPGTEDDEELKGDYEELEDPEVPMADAPEKEEASKEEPPKTGDINVALFASVAILVLFVGGIALGKKNALNK